MNRYLFLFIIKGFWIFNLFLFWMLYYLLKDYRNVLLYIYNNYFKKLIGILLVDLKFFNLIGFFNIFFLIY